MNSVGDTMVISVENFSAAGSVRRVAGTSGASSNEGGIAFEGAAHP